MAIILVERRTIVEKIYTVSPMGKDTDLFEVCIYKNGVEVDYHVVSRESRLQELISDLEAEGYERDFDCDDDDMN